MANVLVRGANAPLRGAGDQPVPRVRVEVSWGSSDRSEERTSLLTVACDARGRALSPAHQVTYQGPTTTGTSTRFEILMDLEAVPPESTNVAFAIATDGSSVRQLDSLAAKLRDEKGQELARYVVEDVGDWPALVVLEVYRRNQQWKVRALGHGLADGYAGLLRSFALVG